MHIHQRLCCPKQRVCSISVLPLYTVLSQLLYAFPTVQKVLNEQKLQRAKRADYLGWPLKRGVQFHVGQRYLRNNAIGSSHRRIIRTSSQDQLHRSMKIAKFQSYWNRANRIHRSPPRFFSFFKVKFF